MNFEKIFILEFNFKSFYLKEFKVILFYVCVSDGMEMEKQKKNCIHAKKNLLYISDIGHVDGFFHLVFLLLLFYRGIFLNWGKNNWFGI